MGNFFAELKPRHVYRARACVPTIVSIIVSMIVMVQGHSAEAADVKLVGATPMAGAIKEIAAQFERDTGHKIITKFVSGPTVKRQIDAGEAFDVAISVTAIIDTLVKEGKLAADTRVDLASVGIGLGVHVGAPKPDIGSVDAFKRTLLNAKSVAYSVDGVGAVYFRGLLDRLGIAEQMKPKLKPMPDDMLARAVASGEAEMIVGAASNVMESGADLVGPVPRELQISIPFTAGISATAKETEAAKALISFLRTPAAAMVMKAKGMEPK
jgi:molybdate transport system substrate-binding protein